MLFRSVVGPSDAGKSTFINKLLGENVVPSHWTPATGMAIKIIHSSEKPEWVTGNTLIVKNDLKVDKAPAEPFNLRDRKYFDEHVKLEGGRDIVEEYGEREGDKYNSELAEEEVIFTYVDSEILNTIDIYDTPGTDAGEDETSEMDEQISADMRNNADAVIYLMTANQFLHRQDFQLLRRDIERLPSLFDGKNGLGKLSNLFIVASQADIIDSEEDRNRILRNGAKRFSKTLSTEFFDRLNCTPEDLSKRFFALSNKVGKEDISYKFEEDFVNFVKESQNIILSNSILKRNKLLRSHISEIEKGISKVEEDRINHEKLVEEANEKEAYLPTILQANKDFSNKLKKELIQSKSTAKSKFKLYYKNLLNKDSLLQEIENGGYKNSKDDKEIFANKISNLLADKYKGILDSETSKLEENIRKIPEKIQISTQIPTSFFDFKAATLGLGDVHFLIGPITLPPLIILWGPIYVLFFRNAWKGKLAQSLIEGYENQDALGQYLDGIETFIKDTEKGVDDIKKGLDIAAKEDVKLSKLRSEANPQDFDNEIKQLKGFESSFKEVTSNYH